MAKIYLTGRRDPLTVSDDKAKAIDNARDKVSGSQKLEIRASEAIVSCKFSDIKFIELPASEEIEQKKDYIVNRLSENQLIDLSSRYDHLLITSCEKGDKYPHTFARDSICVIMGGLSDSGAVIVEKYNQMTADLDQLMYWRHETKALACLQREYPDFKLMHSKTEFEESYKQLIGE